MKKTLLLLSVLMFLFISVSPAGARLLPGCFTIKDPVGIKEIDSEVRAIKAPYLQCGDVVGNYWERDAWLFITERTRITTFDELAVGTLIKFAFVPVDRFHLVGDATYITIYPE